MMEKDHAGFRNGTELLNDSSRKNGKNSEVYKLYFRRWLILAVFSLTCMMSTEIWIGLSTITSIVHTYYQVNPLFIDWLALISSLQMVVLMVPFSYLLNRFGLRLNMITGAMFNALGSCIRLVGAGRHGFVYVFTGNCICGLAHCVLFFLPPHIAAVWFGDRERTMASSVGMLVNVSGVGVAYLLSTFFVSQVRANKNEIVYGMRSLLMFEAITTTLLFLLTLFITKDAPPTPPSRAQDLRAKMFEANVGGTMAKPHIRNDVIQLKSLKYECMQEKDDSINCRNGYSTFEAEKPGEEVEHTAPGFKESLKMLLTDKQFHLLCQAYAIYTGSNYTYTTVLNQITVSAFPGKEKEIGYMGFAALMSGLLSMFLSGAFLNKTKLFKVFTVLDFVLAMIITLLLTIALHTKTSIQIVFILYIFFGFFTYPYMSVGLEYVAEITYPVPEIISSSLCLLLASLYSIIVTQTIGSQLNNGINVGGYIMSGLYALGFLLVVMVKGSLRRSSVDDKTEMKEEN